MALDVNTVVLTGNLTADPELREVSKNDRDYTFCDFSIAVNSGRDGDGNDREPHYFDIKTFGANAKACGEHLAKGRHVTVLGELRLEKWLDKETQAPRRTIKIAASQVKFGPKP